jgi:hypothetical protein
LETVEELSESHTLDDYVVNDAIDLQVHQTEGTDTASSILGGSESGEGWIRR